MAWGDDRSYTQRGTSLVSQVPGGHGAMTEAIHREVNYDLWG